MTLCTFRVRCGLLLVAIAAIALSSSNAFAQGQFPVVTEPGQRVYTYPEGQYDLQGSGAPADPYYWVWIPRGAQSVPTPPALPGTAPAGQTVASQNQRVYTYSNGRFELRGDGSGANPFIWVWIPNQVVPIPPPLPSATTAVAPRDPRLAQRTYSYPEGRYELRGDGSSVNPLAWVWIPTGITSVPNPPPLPRIAASGPNPSAQRVYTYPDGRYELRGTGTTADPYYWVWMPTGMSAAILPSLPVLPQ